MQTDDRIQKLMKKLKSIMNFRKAEPVSQKCGVVQTWPLQNFRLAEFCIPSTEGRMKFHLMKYLKGVGQNIQHFKIKNAGFQIIVNGVLLVFSGILYAQKSDTLTPLRDFVNISNGYKQMPMYLSLEMKNSTNFITGEDDTSSVHGEFFLRNENSYVHFGEFEQVINDSVALLVSNKLHQMILYTNAAPVVQQMKNMMGMSFPDSSIRHLAEKYTSAAKEQSKITGTIELQSRAFVYGTSLSRETIKMQYSLPGKLPEQVTTLRRSLLRLDSSQYNQLQNDPALIDKLLALEGSYFLIKEQVTAYIYKKIDKAAVVHVPVTIKDRITKNENGEYLPAKKYEMYRLIVND
jgi:hypothetical protein